MPGFTLPPWREEVGLRLTQGDLFARVPHWVVTHPDVNPSALKVYATLSMRANNSTRLAFPGIRRIAIDSHMATSTVLRGIETLEQVGAVVISRTKVKGHRQTNHYHLPAFPFGGVLNLNTPPVSELNTHRADSEHTGVLNLNTELDPSELDERTRTIASLSKENPRLPKESRSAYARRLSGMVDK